MTATSSVRPARLRLWGLLFVLSGTMLLDALEVSVALVALPAIRAEFGLGPATLHWVVTGFALGFGGSVLFGRRVVERFGRRRVYLAALAGFAVTSLLGAAAGDPVLLVASRFAKGFCVALTAPTGLSIIAASFAEGTPRNRAVAVYSLFGASGFSVGLLLSGVLTGFSWRAAFLFPAPVAVAVLLAGIWLVPRDEPVSGSPLDVAGATAFVGAVAALLCGITLAGAAGVAGWLTWSAFAVAAALFVVFARVERASAAPLVPLRLLRRPSLVRAMLGAIALNGTNWGFLYLVTQQLQEGAGWPPLRAGLAMIVPASLLLALTAPMSGGLVGRFGAARLIAIGAAAPPIGYALYLAAGPQPDYLTHIMPSMAFVGFGFALGFAALHVQAVSGAAPHEHGVVSAVYQTAVQIGGALVLAAVAATLAVNTPGAAPSAGSAVTAQRPALVLLVAIGAAGLLVAFTGWKPRNAQGRTEK